MKRRASSPSSRREPPSARKGEFQDEIVGGERERGVDLEGPDRVDEATHGGDVVVVSHDNRSVMTRSAIPLPPRHAAGQRTFRRHGIGQRMRHDRLMTLT